MRRGGRGSLDVAASRAASCNDDDACTQDQGGAIDDGDYPRLARAARGHRTAGRSAGAAATARCGRGEAWSVPQRCRRDRRLRPQALWWSLSTITTVGYGDMYPVTAAGRIIAGFTMIVGISTFAVVTAKIAQLLLRSESSDRAA